MKRIDLTGQRFGRWLVLEFSYKKGSNYYWKCKCNCGKIKCVSSKSFKQGDSKSCGCYRKEHFELAFGESATNHIYRMYRDNAKKHKRPFTITKEEFKRLIKQNCSYCGTEPAQKHKMRGGRGHLIYNGIDRLDNNKGYEPGNCVPCCGDCNYMKRSMSVKNFLQHIKKIYNKQFSGL